MPDKKVPVLVKAFEEFALFCKDRWRAALLAVVFIALLGSILLSLFYGYRSIELLGTELDRGLVILEDSHVTADQLQSDFQSSVEENRLVDDQMTKCVFKYNASAMLVFKFHNSRTDLQGKHDFFYSATNEISSNGITNYLPDAQTVPIVRLGKYITPMIEGKCRVVHVNVMKDNDWLKRKLTLSGIETVVSCPIHDKGGNLLGFTELIYTTQNPAPVDTEQFVKTLESFRRTTDNISLIVQK